MAIETYLFHLRLIVTLLMYAIATIGIGLRIQQLTLKVKKIGLREWWWGYFFGQAVLATLILIVSSFLPAPLSWFVLSIPLIFGFKWAFSLRPDWRNAFPTWNILELGSMAILLGIFGFLTIYSLHRPSEWDEVSYHYPVMQELAAGKVEFPLLQKSPYVSFYQPFSFFYGSLPYASETYASLAYGLAGNHPSTAHVIYMINVGVFLLIINEFLKTEFQVKKLSRIIVCTLIILDSGILILLSTGLIDVSTSIFQILSCLLLIYADKTAKRGYVWLSFLCLGAAFGHKFTTAFMLPAFIIGLIMVSRKLGKMHEIVWYGGWWAFLGGGIWYFKNLLLHQNPVYPLYLGHVGLTDEQYLFLKETLIEGLRAPITLAGVGQTLISQYKNNLGFVLTIVVLLVGWCVTRLKVQRSEIFLFLVAIGMFGMNYVFGSQLSRYVLIVPITVYVLAARFFNKAQWSGIIILALLLVFQKNDPVLKAFWKARLAELPYVTSLGHKLDSKDRIGCVANVYQFCKTHCSESGSVLNLWDAYAAVYYQDVPLFTSVETTVFEQMKLSNQIKYVYSNAQWKSDLVKSVQAHRDMRPVERADFEQKLLAHSVPIFQDDNCSVYKIVSTKDEN